MRPKDELVERLNELQKQLEQARRDADNNARWFRAERALREETKLALAGALQAKADAEAKTKEAVTEAEKAYALGYKVGFENGHAQATKYERERRNEFTIRKLMADIKRRNGLNGLPDEAARFRTLWGPIGILERALKDLERHARFGPTATVTQDTESKKRWTDAFLALLDYAQLRGWDQLLSDGQLELKMIIASRWAEIRDKGDTTL